MNNEKHGNCHTRYQKTSSYNAIFFQKKRSYWHKIACMHNSELPTTAFKSKSRWKNNTWLKHYIPILEGSMSFLGNLTSCITDVKPEDNCRIFNPFFDCVPWIHNLVLVTLCPQTMNVCKTDCQYFHCLNFYTSKPFLGYLYWRMIIDISNITSLEIFYHN